MYTPVYQIDNSKRSKITAIDKKHSYIVLLSHCLIIHVKRNQTTDLLFDSPRVVLPTIPIMRDVDEEGPRARRTVLASILVGYVRKYTGLFKIIGVVPSETRPATGCEPGADLLPQTGRTGARWGGGQGGHQESALGVIYC